MLIQTLSHYCLMGEFIQGKSNRTLNINSRLMFKKPPCFLNRSKAAQHCLVDDLGRWSLQVEVAGSPAVSGVGVTQEGTPAVDADLRSKFLKAQGKLWS